MEERSAQQASPREAPLANTGNASESRNDIARNNDQEALNSAWDLAERNLRPVDVVKEGITPLSNPQNAEIE